MDSAKDQANQRKHGISFETACLVFDDPNHLSLQDRHVGNEERWQTMGLIDGLIVLLVAHTYYEEDGEEVIRIISARKATAHERKSYEQA
ncbi:MAG: BrnT family toxin [Gammaproteobacteria bacterium]|nr:BrnT family toxin [Gammaproteobacteria bacterium]